MSSSSSESDNALTRLLGNAFLFVVPGILIVMLGYVGWKFVVGIVQDDAPSASAGAPVAAVSTTDSGATAPSAPAASGAAASGGGEADVMAVGKMAYMTCAACHGPDGTGLKVGPALMAPSLVGSPLLLDPNPDKAMLVILKGIAKEDMKFMGVMAPLGAGLDDAKLAAVMTYTRNEWGNSGPAVTVEEAAAARAKFAEVNPPAGVKRAEIEAIISAHP